MHIALISHNIIPGDGQGHVNVQLTRYLLRAGARVTLVANRVDNGLLEEGADWIPIETGNLGEAIDLVKVWHFKRKADRLLQDIHRRFDAVIACGVVCDVPHTLNAVHFAHGGWLRAPYHPARKTLGVNGAYQWLFSFLNDRWERQTLRKAEHIVAVSKMVKQELIASGLPAEKISVIVNGVDVQTFHPGPADREVLGLPDRVPLVLFVGDIRSTIKNPDGLLRAAARVPGVHVALAGSLEGSPLPELAEQMNIRDRVHFLGFRRDVPELMRAADFFALPSRRDSCPLVLLEALASGLPVVTSGRVGIADLVADGACGFVIENPEDGSSLQSALSALASDVTTREEMGQCARHVATAHTWERMAEGYLEVIEDRLRSEQTARTI